MFASKTISGHLTRGALGLGALAASGSLAAEHPWLSLALIPAALLALRGCPLCWTVGLFQTVAARLRGVPASDACLDGACALPRARRL